MAAVTNAPPAHLCATAIASDETYAIRHVPIWLALYVLALIVRAGQRLLSKVALQDLGTRKFYLLSAVVSHLTYTPYLIIQPPAISELLPEFGLACLMAITFGVTTEAIRRGPLGAVSPITPLSPALTALLAIGILNERVVFPRISGSPWRRRESPFLAWAVRRKKVSLDGRFSQSLR